MDSRQSAIIPYMKKDISSQDITFTDHTPDSNLPEKHLSGRIGHDVLLDSPYTVVDLDDKGRTIERSVHLVHGETTEFFQDVHQTECSSANSDSLLDKDVVANIPLSSKQSRDSPPIISPSVYCQPSAISVQSTNAASLPICENKINPNSLVNESKQMNDSSDDLLKMMSAMSISSYEIIEDTAISTVNDSRSTVVVNDINFHTKQLDGFEVSTALHSTTDDQDYNASEKQTDLATDDVHVVTVDGVEGKLTEPSFYTESNESKYNHDDEKCSFTEMKSTENEMKAYEIGRSDDIKAPSKITTDAKQLDGFEVSTALHSTTDDQDYNASEKQTDLATDDVDVVTVDGVEGKLTEPSFYAESNESKYDHDDEKCSFTEMKSTENEMKEYEIGRSDDIKAPSKITIDAKQLDGFEVSTALHSTTDDQDYNASEKQTDLATDDVHVVTVDGVEGKLIEPSFHAESNESKYNHGDEKCSFTEMTSTENEMKGYEIGKSDDIKAPSKMTIDAKQLDGFEVSTALHSTTDDQDYNASEKQTNLATDDVHVVTVDGVEGKLTEPSFYAESNESKYNHGDEKCSFTEMKSTENEMKEYEIGRSDDIIAPSVITIDAKQLDGFEVSTALHSTTDDQDYNASEKQTDLATDDVHVVTVDGVEGKLIEPSFHAESNESKYNHGDEKCSFTEMTSTENEMKAYGIGRSDDIIAPSKITIDAKQLDGFEVSTALHSTTDDQDYNASEKQTDLATDDVHVVTVDGVEGKLTEPSFHAESNESKYNHGDEKCSFTEMTSTENEIKAYEIGRSDDIKAPSKITIDAKQLDGFEVSTALHSTTDDQDDYNASEKQTDLATDDVHVVTVDGVEGKLTEPSFHAESNESKYNHGDEKCSFTEMRSTENEMKEYEIGRSDDIKAPSVMTISRKPLPDNDNQDFTESKSTEQEMDSFIAWDEFLNKELSKHVSPTESELRKQSLYVQFDPLVKRSPLIKDPKYVGSESEGSVSGGDNVFETPKQKLIDIESDEVEESTNRSSPSVIMMNIDEYDVDDDGRSSIMIPSHQPTHTTSYVDDTDQCEEIQKMEEESKIKRRERECEILRMEEELKQLDAELVNQPDDSDVLQLLRVIKECESEADVILEKAELDLNANKQMVHESTSDCISSNEVLENYRKKTKNVVSLLKNKNQVENLLRSELDQNLQMFAEDLRERNKVEINSKEEDLKFKKETNDMMAMEDREILARVDS
ncbi:uncharacterized protein LOC100182105 isoform X1 [Ciona intestinalis]